MSAEALLAVRSVQKAFDGVPALVDGRLELRAGEVHALVGENGAGKSTLMKIVAGALSADAGSMELAGRVYAPQSPRAAFDAGVHLVHQELMLVDELSVAENLFLGREPTRRPWLDRSSMEERAAGILRTMGVDRRPDERLGDLSIGERQLVEVGRVLTHDVRVLVMDEPSATLTDAEIERLFTVVRDLRARGAGIVWISHRLEEIGVICDSVTTMRDGAHVRTADVADYSREQIVRDMVGRDVAAVARTRRPAGEEALAVRGFTRRGQYEGVDLALRCGEVLGLFGLVGSGRTELALGILGDPPPETGTATLRGRTFRPTGPGDALRHGVGMLTEDRQGRGLVPDRTVAENVTLSALSRFVRRGFLRLGAERAFAEGMRERLGIRTASMDLPVRALSGGNQQKALLARLLATEASVLIVDEPTRGVDVGAKAEIHDLLDGLARGGAAILAISSDLPELLSLADRIGVMREGRLVDVLEREDATPEAIMARATGTVEVGT